MAGALGASVGGAGVIGVVCGTEGSEKQASCGLGRKGAGGEAGEIRGWRRSSPFPTAGKAAAWDQIPGKGLRCGL